MPMSEQLNELRELLRNLERSLGLIDDSAKSCCGITLAQCHALVEIGRAEALSLNALAELLDLDKSTASRTIDHLVRRNYATRQADARNRRSVVIRLTAAGHDLFMGIEADMNHYFKQIQTAIPADKQEQLLDSLRLLTLAIGQVKTGTPVPRRPDDTSEVTTCCSRPAVPAAN